MKTRFFSGDVNWKQYGGKFISKKLNNGDWDYFLIIDFINMLDATGDENIDKYSVSVQAVAPSAVSEDDIKKAFDCIGIDFSSDPMLQVEALSSYGIYATLKSVSGNNAAKLLKECKKELDAISCMFGFYMDGAKNRIGNTGWDFIAGNIGFKSL